MVSVLLAAMLSQTSKLPTEKILVDGTEREFLIHSSSTKKASPLVFVFHGLGSNMAQVAMYLDVDKKWPEATVVFPNGLETRGRRAWQFTSDPKGRDIQFFDALLADLVKRKLADPKRVYVTGHSNGGMLSYTLWLTRAAKIRAVAPLAAYTFANFQPASRPVFHAVGDNDRVVATGSQDQTIARVLKLNGARQEGTKWDADCLMYKGTSPTVIYRYKGGHMVPSNTAALVTRFFKEN